MNFLNKKVLVCGMARSGIASALFLTKQKAIVTLQDVKKITDFDIETINLLEENEINLYFGKNPDDIVSSYDLIVVSPGIPFELNFFEIAKNNNIPVVSEIELGFYFSKSPIIAITGTNGKTTTTTLVGEILKKQFENVNVVGNIGVPFTDTVLKTTSDSFIVLEASSFQLETTEKFKPLVSSVLNISPDHLDRHFTMENYILAKEKVFANQDANDFLVLNYKDECCKKMSVKSKAKTIFFNGNEDLENSVYLENNIIYSNLFGKSEKIININELQLLGTHNYENVMAAIAICKCVGTSLETIKEVLKTFKGVAHRMEFVSVINNIDFYNDSKGTNPDSAIKSINAIEKPIILIAGGFEKNADFTDWVKSFKGKVKYVAIIGEVKDRMANTFLENGFENFEKLNSFDEAFQKATENATSGDCILLSPACASWGMFKDFEERGEVFKSMVKDFKGKNF